jgi:hypothetical protein
LYRTLNGLAQVLVKMTTRGVPDSYQGCVLWDLRLVDPYNRGPSISNIGALCGAKSRYEVSRIVTICFRTGKTLSSSLSHLENFEFPSPTSSSIARRELPAMESFMQEASQPAVLCAPHRPCLGADRRTKMAGTRESANQVNAIPMVLAGFARRSPNNAFKSWLNAFTVRRSKQDFCEKDHLYVRVILSEGSGCRSKDQT